MRYSQTTPAVYRRVLSTWWSIMTAKCFSTHFRVRKLGDLPCHVHRTIMQPPPRCLPRPTGLESFPTAAAASGQLLMSLSPYFLGELPTSTSEKGDPWNLSRTTYEFHGTLTLSLMFVSVLARFLTAASVNKLIILQKDMVCYVCFRYCLFPIYCMRQ